MGRDGIVIGEPSGQLVAHRARGREVCAGEVVTAQRVNETLPTYRSTQDSRPES